MEKTEIAKYYSALSNGEKGRFTVFSAYTSEVRRILFINAK